GLVEQRRDHAAEDHLADRISDQFLAPGELHGREAGTDLNAAHADLPGVRNVLDELVAAGAEEELHRELAIGHAGPLSRLPWARKRRCRLFRCMLWSRALPALDPSP